MGPEHTPGRVHGGCARLRLTESRWPRTPELSAHSHCSSEGATWPGAPHCLRHGPAWCVGGSVVWDSGAHGWPLSADDSDPVWMKGGGKQEGWTAWSRTLRRIWGVAWTSWWGEGLGGGCGEGIQAALGKLRSGRERAASSRSQDVPGAHGRRILEGFRLKYQLKHTHLVPLFLQISRKQQVRGSMRKTKEGITTAQPGKLADEQEPTEKGIPKPAGGEGGEGWHQPQGQAGCSKGLETGVAGISAGGRRTGTMEY